MSWIQVTTTATPPVTMWVNLDGCDTVTPASFDVTQNTDTTPNADTVGSGAVIVFRMGNTLTVTSTPDALMLQAATGSPIK